jgi:epoxyqueuosine reductase QueG
MVIDERTEIRSAEKARIVSDGEELEAFARSLGAEIYGVASAEAYQEFTKKPQPGKFVLGAKSVVVIGMPNSPDLYATVAKPAMAEIVKRPGEEAIRAPKDIGKPPAGAERYFINEEVAMLTTEVVRIAYKISRKLNQEGYHAFYFGPFQQEARFKTAAFYFMPAMYLAGIGQMGLNCSILTPEFGPRIWVTTVITDKELPAGQPVGPTFYEDCKSCLECVKRCPSTALDGKGWKNVFRCATYGCCGTCLSVCPVGKAST